MARCGACAWDAGNGWSGQYCGQLFFGKPQGLGVLTMDSEEDDGDEYEGYFLDGKFHGKGTATYGHLDQYVGGWKEGKKHGHGVRTYDFGSAKYEGQWQADQMHGYGMYIYADGRAKCGKWEHDVLKVKMPRDKVEAMIRASQRTAAKENAASTLDNDAGLLDLLRTTRFETPAPAFRFRSSY